MKVPKRIRRRILTLLLLVLIGYLSQHTNWLNRSGQVIQQAQPGYYRVVSVQDGDTITVDMNGTKETIRLIGIDTPETKDPRKPVQCFGEAASAFTKQAVGQKEVRLEADPLSSNRDRYDRLLRYVYLPDGTFVNAVIVREGYGFAYLSFPFTKSEEFRQYAESARAANKGLWQACESAENNYGGFTTQDAP